MIVNIRQSKGGDIDAACGQLANKKALGNRPQEHYLKTCGLRTNAYGLKPMNDIKDFKDLIVWQKVMDLVVEVYNLVKKLPKEEQFALSDQKF